MPDWTIPADYRQKSVPDKLREAVIDQREMYARALDDVARQMIQGCRASFHHAPGDPASKVASFDLAQLANGLDQTIRDRFNRRIQERTAPATFRAYFDLFGACMSIKARALFLQLLEIGAANVSIIQRDFNRWAERQTENVIGTYHRAIAAWAVDMCEVAAGMRDDVDEVAYSVEIFEIAGRKGTWRAPRFLIMDPSPIAYEPEDTKRTWEPLDEATSVECLRRLASALCDQLRKTVGDAAQKDRFARAVGSNRQPAEHTGTVEDSNTDESRSKAKQFTSAKAVQRSRIQIQNRKRYEVIFGAIQTVAEGIAYCRILKNRNLPLPPNWVKNGGSRDYVAAYDNPKLKQKINDEKSKYRRNYDLMSKQDRELIIEGKFD